MKLARAIWLGVLLVLAATAGAKAGAAAPQSKYLIKDVAAPQPADYLIIAGDRFAGHLDALADHRAGQGYTVAIARMSDVKARYKTIRAFLAHAVQKWKPRPRFLLLAGDVETVPTVVKKARMSAGFRRAKTATDFDYARPLGETVLLHVGRLPCDTAKELGVMIRKTIDYETKLPGGPWQRKLGFIATVGGYGKKIDALLEKVATTVLTSVIPPTYDIEAAYANPNSVYCPYPPDIHAKAMRMLNDGALIYFFVGHGSSSGVAELRWRGRSYEVLHSRHAPQINVRNGLPILLLFTCSAGKYDASDCLGENFLKAPKGPVACVAASRTIREYGNMLFARASAVAIASDAKTIGELVTQAKRTVTAHKFSTFRLQADAFGMMMTGRKALEPIRKDIVEQYNLLGDPALVIRRPKLDIEVRVTDSEVRVSAPGRKRVVLTLECPPGRFARPLPAIARDDPKYKARMNARFRSANDKVLKRWRIDLKGGRGAVTFTRPSKPGAYYVKAAAGGSVGWSKLVVAPKPSTAPAGK